MKPVSWVMVLWAVAVCVALAIMIPLANSRRAHAPAETPAELAALVDQYNRTLSGARRGEFDADPEGIAEARRLQGRIERSENFFNKYKYWGYDLEGLRHIRDRE